SYGYNGYSGYNLFVSHLQGPQRISLMVTQLQLGLNRIRISLLLLSRQTETGFIPFLEWLHQTLFLNKSLISQPNLTSSSLGRPGSLSISDFIYFSQAFVYFFN
ncbi:hypothetical protein Dimus_035456, partial [Dionaea muscipula]